jgi:hypothetical protein
MSEDLKIIKLELSALRGAVEVLAARLQPAAQSRPLTARELIVRWAIPGSTERHQLANLAKKCRQRGLEPMKGARGLAATYMVADVQAAECHSNGTVKRRRKAA